MGWMDDIAGVREVLDADDVTYPTRARLKFAGGYVGVADDPVGEATVVTVAGLVPTAVKTANYVASPGDFVLVDTTAGDITITLPAAGKPGAQIGVKVLEAGNTVTLAGDVVGDQSGDVELENINQAAVFVRGATGSWYCISVVPGYAP